ncbi:MAG: tetratricopeptide repeat protein [Tepidisphaeraceae bacterium]
MKHGLLVILFISTALTQMASATRVAILADPNTDAGRVAVLIEANLSNFPNISLVERSQLEQVINEQELQDCFAPEAVSQRAALGKLVHADILVLLRSRPLPHARIETIVCETHEGLRLLAQSLPEANHPEQDASLIQASVAQSIEKGQQKVSAIVAVPPLICQDLSYEFAYLGPAYSRLLENSLLARPGVLVVELNEARAIEAELRLTGPANIERPLPFYLLGQYTDNGFGSARRVIITLALKRGENELSKVTSGELSPRDTSAFILRTAEDLLRRAGQQMPPAPDPKEEASLLADQAYIHQRLGEWDEALDLFESSLLLDPTQTQLHFDVINTLHDIRHPGDTGNREMFFEKYGDQVMTMKERELEHLEPWFRRTRIGLDTSKTVECANFLSRCGGIYFRDIPYQYKQRALALDRRKRELFFSVLEARLKAGQTEFYRVPLGVGNFCIGVDSLEEGHQVRLRAIRLYKDAPGTRYQVSMFLWFGYAPAELADPSWQELLNEAAAIDSPGVREGIADARRQADQNIASTRPIAPRIVSSPAPSLSAPRKTPQVTFTPLALTITDENGNSLVYPEQITTWLVAGRGIDAAFDRSAIYIMKTKGVLRRVFSSDHESFRFSSPSFDGRYLWAPLVDETGGAVIVVDPSLGRIVARFDASDGLPPMTRRGAAGGLDPGRACVSGGFGRGWIAILQLNADGSKKVNVFFEAKDQPDHNHFDDKKPLHTAFAPDYMFVLRGRDSQNHPATRLLVGRIDSWTYNPLLVDPYAQAAQVFDYPPFLGEPPTDGTIQDGQLFTALRSPSTFGVGRVVKYSLPDLKPSVVASVPAFGPITFSNDHVYILGAQWMRSEVPEGPYMPLYGPIPGHEFFRRIFHSNFYGLVLALYNSDRGAFAVNLPDSKS